MSRRSTPRPRGSPAPVAAASRGTGRPPAGGIALNVVRRKSRGRKPVDLIVFAEQLSATRWKAHANLPFGLITLYAIPLTAEMDDLDGEGDVQRYRISSG